MSQLRHRDHFLESGNRIKLIMIDSKRKSLRAVFLFFLFSTSAFSSELKPLYGEWGNAAQCARTLITPNGTKYFTPFNIQADWLSYGGLWCRLIWSEAQTTQEGINVVASARCGEDTVREYQIAFHLRGDVLVMRWNQDLENGPLTRCVN